MSAILKPLGMLKDYTNGLSEVDAPVGVSVRQALEDLSIPPELVALVLVNEKTPG